MAVITSAILAGAAIVGTVGQAYSQHKAAKQQQKMANVQNARERKMALRAMRVQQRALEASGVASGTAGGSGVVGAMGATASATASGIGFQSSLLANAQKITHWNNMATGFGALASVASTLSQYPGLTTPKTTTTATPKTGPALFPQ